MKMNQNIKKLILITLMALAITGCSKEESNINNDSGDTVTNIEQTQLDKEESDLPNYKVALIDDANIGNAIRETLHIVVEEDYTLEQLYDIAQKEALAYVSENKVNALAIGFYEDEDNIGQGYDMGRVEYVPYGDWSKAVDVETGDYSNFEFVNHLEESISSYFTEGTPITEDEGETDINLVKSDIEGVYDGLDVNVTKKNSVLIINVVETQDAILEANELTISAYTDWCLDNIKSDIKSIDFTVETNNGTVRALLDTSKIETDNGRYFNSNYIAENIQK